MPVEHVHSKQWDQVNAGHEEPYQRQCNWLGHYLYLAAHNWLYYIELGSISIPVSSLLCTSPCPTISTCEIHPVTIARQELLFHCFSFSELYNLFIRDMFRRLLRLTFTFFWFFFCCCCLWMIGRIFLPFTRPFSMTISTSWDSAFFIPSIRSNLYLNSNLFLAPTYLIHDYFGQ